MASALLPQDKENEQEKALYEQERFRPVNIAFDPEVHKNLLPVELSGFRVHMIVEQNEDAPRIPKQIKEGLRNRKREATDVEFSFLAAMQKKMLWFQFHKEHIRPVFRFEKRMDGTQVNVVGKRFLKRGAGVYDCAVVDHYLNIKTPWFKYRICIGNAAERTHFKWSNFTTVLKTPVASDAVSTLSITNCIAMITVGGLSLNILTVSRSIMIWISQKTLQITRLRWRL